MYRETELYKNMTPYDAIELVEGFGRGENATVEEQLTAWQYLWDTKLCFQFQGRIGRVATDLVENGDIEA